MNQSETISQPRALILSIIGTILIIVGLFMPMALGVSVYSIDYFLISMTWSMRFGAMGGGIIGGIWFFHTCVVLSFLRLAFVYQIYRLYKGFTTISKTIQFGIVAELQFIVSMQLFNLFLSVTPTSIVVPIPLLLLSAAIILKLIPYPKEPLMWIERELPWWLKNKQGFFKILGMNLRY